MTTSVFPLHHHEQVEIDTDPAALFELLDDHQRLSAHMEWPSLLTAGATLRIETDEQQGRAVGSLIGMRGRVLGLAPELEELVLEHDPPRRKVWETRGAPRLLVIGSYRMGFAIEPQSASGVPAPSSSGRNCPGWNPGCASSLPSWAGSWPARAC